MPGHAPMRLSRLTWGWLPLVLLVTAVIVTACDKPPSGQLFSTHLPTTDHEPLLVTLHDQTGIVASVAPGPPDARAMSAARVDADPADPNAFVLSWVGGLCDAPADVTFVRGDSGYSLQLLDPAASGSCPAVGVERGLLIKTSIPIAMGSIAVINPGH